MIGLDDRVVSIHRRGGNAPLKFTATRGCRDGAHTDTPQQHNNKAQGMELICAKFQMNQLLVMDCCKRQMICKNLKKNNKKYILPNL